MCSHRQGRIDNRHKQHRKLDDVEVRSQKFLQSVEQDRGKTENENAKNLRSSQRVAHACGYNYYIILCTVQIGILRDCSIYNIVRQLWSVMSRRPSICFPAIFSQTWSILNGMLNCKAVKIFLKIISKYFICKVPYVPDLLPEEWVTHKDRSTFFLLMFTQKEQRRFLTVFPLFCLKKMNLINNALETMFQYKQFSTGPD